MGTNGEALPIHELNKALGYLVSFESTDALKERIDSTYFAETILGFEEVDEAEMADN